MTQTTDRTAARRFEQAFEQDYQELRRKAPRMAAALKQQVAAVLAREK